ncbi:MAG: glutamate racemase [Candidatus Kerfeldbacteria bacterium]|nr:glutamate racemase [Candidatus Kerfeldbacteria bacterium]
MIGVFDSGVGGLSVLREMRKALPQSDFLYFGDTANVPYGGRKDEHVRQLSEAAVQRLLKFNPDLVVVACNTATSIAINQLRLDHTKLPIVGVVPVLKTAAEQTKTNKIAVLATVATLTSRTYADLKEQFARDVEVLELALPEWVLLVERGILDGPEVQQSVQQAAERIRSSGADIVTLGCTHFPFLRPTIVAAMPGIEVLDSGPAVARQVVRVLTANQKPPDQSKAGSVTYLCSGDPAAFSQVATRLLGETVSARKA